MLVTTAMRLIPLDFIADMMLFVPSVSMVSPTVCAMDIVYTSCVCYVKTS